MERDRNKEAKFTEYIDRLLAGEQIDVSGEIDDELRSAMDFTKAMLSDRDEPSPAFRAQLRERLLQKLYQQEAEAARARQRRDPREWLRNILPPQSAWRLWRSWR